MAAKVPHSACSFWCVVNLIPIGFPPPDSTLRTFLLSAADPSDNARTAKQLHAFMYSLLSVTHERLQAISTECGDYPVTAFPIIC